MRIACLDYAFARLTKCWDDYCVPVLRSVCDAFTSLGSWLLSIPSSLYRRIRPGTEALPKEGQDAARKAKQVAQDVGVAPAQEEPAPAKVEQVAQDERVALVQEENNLQDRGEEDLSKALVPVVQRRAEARPSLQIPRALLQRQRAIPRGLTYNFPQTFQPLLLLPPPPPTRLDPAPAEVDQVAQNERVALVQEENNLQDRGEEDLSKALVPVVQRRAEVRPSLQIPRALLQRQRAIPRGLTYDFSKMFQTLTLPPPPTRPDPEPARVEAPAQRREPLWQPSTEQEQLLDGCRAACRGNSRSSGLKAHVRLARGEIFMAPAVRNQFKEFLQASMYERDVSRVVREAVQSLWNYGTREVAFEALMRLESAEKWKEDVKHLENRWKTEKIYKK